MRWGNTWLVALQKYHVAMWKSPYSCCHNLNSSELIYWSVIYAIFGKKALKKFSWWNSKLDIKIKCLCVFSCRLGVLMRQLKTKNFIINTKLFDLFLYQKLRKAVLQFYHKEKGAAALIWKKVRQTNSIFQKWV